MKYNSYTIVCEALNAKPNPASLAAKYRKLLADRSAKRTAQDIARRNRLRLQAEEKARKAAAAAKKGS